MAEDSDESEESDGSEGTDEGGSGVADAEERGREGEGLRRRRRGLGGLAAERKRCESSGDSVSSMTKGRELTPGEGQRGSGGEIARQSSTSVAGMRRRAAPLRQSKVRPRD